MNSKYKLILFAILFFSFTSCNKGGNFTLPIVGKYQETKLTLYETDGTAAKLYDTTYMQPFTSNDFLQINADGTCVTGTDHYYYQNVPGQDDSTQLITPVRSTWNYTSTGKAFVLSTQSTLLNPGGFVTADTVTEVDSRTVLLHSVFYSHDGIHQSISDAYYSK